MAGSQTHGSTRCSVVGILAHIYHHFIKSNNFSCGCCCSHQSRETVNPVYYCVRRQWHVPYQFQFLTWTQSAEIITILMNATWIVCFYFFIFNLFGVGVGSSSSKVIFWSNVCLMNKNDRNQMETMSFRSLKFVPASQPWRTRRNHIKLREVERSAELLLPSRWDTILRIKQKETPPYFRSWAIVVFQENIFFLQFSFFNTHSIMQLFDDAVCSYWYYLCGWKQSACALEKLIQNIIINKIWMRLNEKTELNCLSLSTLCSSKYCAFLSQSPMCE